MVVLHAVAVSYAVQPLLTSPLPFSLSALSPLAKYITEDDFASFCARVGLMETREEMKAEFDTIQEGSGRLIFVDFCRWFCRIREDAAASSK